MKKVILFIPIFIYSLASNSQSVNFELQPNGMFLNSADGKNYVVINFPNESKENLYSNVLVAITKMYISPKDVIDKVENEVISVNGLSEDCVLLKAPMGINLYFSVQYLLQFQFKDGKIRVDSPIVLKLYTQDFTEIERPFPKWIELQKLFKNGIPNPKKQNTIDDFNNTINGTINKILSTDNSSDEDW